MPKTPKIPVIDLGPISPFTPSAHQDLISALGLSERRDISNSTVASYSFFSSPQVTCRQNPRELNSLMSDGLNGSVCLNSKIPSSVFSPTQPLSDPASSQVVSDGLTGVSNLGVVFDDSCTDCNDVDDSASDHSREGDDSETSDFLDRYFRDGVLDSSGNASSGNVSSGNTSSGNACGSLIQGFVRSADIAPSSNVKKRAVSRTSSGREIKRRQIYSPMK